MRDRGWWSGNPPYDWRIGRLKDLVQLTNGWAFDSERFGDVGTPLIRIRDLGKGQTDTRYDGPVPPMVEVQDGDLLVGMDGDFNSDVWKGGPAALNQRLCRLSAVHDLDQQYLRYLVDLPLRYINDLTYSTTVKHLSSLELLTQRVPLPPLSEQRAIADFLDAETARIDALIAKKRRLIELLDERFESELRHILRALSAPWLPLKRRWRVVDCKHRTPEYLDEGYPVVSPGDATPGRLDLTRCHRFVGQADYMDLAEPPRRPDRGSIIYSRNASIGIAAYVDTSEPFCMGQDVCLITSRNENQLFLTYVLNTVGVDQLDEAKIGSTFNRVNVSQILEVSVPCPGPEVQQELASLFDTRSRLRDTSRSALTAQIDLLVEHRQALITAAVTGELRVPGVAA